MSTTAADALILESEGPPTLGLEAARVLAKIIRAARDQTAAAPPQECVEDPANRRNVEGH